MPEELVEVVNAEGVVEGMVTRSEMRARNLRHRSVGVVVHRAGGAEVLVHRRAFWKDVWPGYWDLAFGGVLVVAEDWLDGARRDLAEEAGIDVAANDLVYLGPVAFESDVVRVVGKVYAVEHEGP